MNNIELFSQRKGLEPIKNVIHNSKATLLDESNLDFEDAKFMLVSCSAFINYLKVKSSKARNNKI